MIHHHVRPIKDMSILAWQPSEGADADLPSLCAWLADRREEVDQALIEHGGVLIRGFSALRDAQSFEKALSALGVRLMDYVGGTSPRKQVVGRILTATEVPGSFSIPMHQEMSYTDGAPVRIAFFCETPAAQGGATTVGDMRKITQAIDRGVAQKFAAKGGLQLRRNLPLPQFAGQRPGVPKPWTEVFNTTDPGEAQAQAVQRGWRYEWQPDESMTLWQEVRQATKRHPVTGDEVWFNQLNIFAPAAAVAWARKDGRLEMAARLEQAMHDSPHQLDCYVFADGSEIDADDALHVYEVLEREAVPLAWEPGDLLVLDNVLSAHGRLCYSGGRRVLTGLISGGDRA